MQNLLILFPIQEHTGSKEVGSQNGKRQLLATTGQVTAKLTIHIIVKVEAALLYSRAMPFKIYMEMSHLEMMLMSGVTVNFRISIILRSNPEEAAKLPFCKTQVSCISVRNSRGWRWFTHSTIHFYNRDLTKQVCLLK